MSDARTLFLILGSMLPILVGCVERDVAEAPPQAAAVVPVPDRSSAFQTAPAETLASGGGSVVVQPHQTLYGVARQNSIPLRALIDANRLKPPYHVHPGQTLVVPRIRQHVVQPGETLYAVSRRFNVEATTLARLNHLQPPYVIRRGTALILPPDSGVARAGPMMPSPKTGQYAAAAPFAAPRVAEETNKGPAAIEATPLVAPAFDKAASSNKAASPQLPPLPSKVVEAPGSALPAKLSASPPQTASATVLPPLPSKTIGGAGPASPKLQDDGADTEDAGADAGAQPPPSGTKLATVSAGGAAALVRNHRAPSDPMFYWPARGKIISVFGPTAGGTHNDGINIAAPEGTIISAAESGVVAYAGDQLKGFGNLLLIKHDSGWVSAYAHNQVLLVTKGERVRRGQPIARVGTTGGVSQPQLHFELREGVKAVDPLDHLPQLATAAG